MIEFFKFYFTIIIPFIIIFGFLFEVGRRVIKKERTWSFFVGLMFAVPSGWLLLEYLKSPGLDEVDLLLAFLYIPGIFFFCGIYEIYKGFRTDKNKLRE